MMESYQQRVIDEKTALTEKFDRLSAFLNGDTFKGLTEQDQELLVEQHEVMDRYITILNMRIKRFEPQP